MRYARSATAKATHIDERMSKQKRETDMLHSEKLPPRQVLLVRLVLLILCRGKILARVDGVLIVAGVPAAARSDVLSQLEWVNI